MTDQAIPLTQEAFDWNKVGPELEALGQAIADTIDPSDPMQTNESTMDCLEHLWSLGYRVVPHPAAARRAIEGSGVVEARQAIEQAVMWNKAPGRVRTETVGAWLDKALAALPRPEEAR